MPWCQRCDRFLNPNTVTTDGTCPSCGQTVDGPGVDRAEKTESNEVGPDEVLGDEVLDDDDVSAPWHFWVMVAGVVLYLAWRLVEAIIWGADRLF